MTERAPNPCPVCGQLATFDEEISAFRCQSCRSDWPDPVEERIREARAEGFEEAAKVCDRLATKEKRWRDAHTLDVGAAEVSEIRERLIRQCAGDIRSLAEETS